MERGGAAGDGEPQPLPVAPTRDGLVASNAARGHASELFVRHSGTIVECTHSKASRVRNLEEDSDVPTPPVVAHGVENDVAHGLLQHGHVRLGEDDLRWERTLDRDALLLGHDTVPLDDAVDQVAQVDLPQKHLRRARVESSRHRQVAEERPDAVGLAHRSFDVLPGCRAVAGERIGERRDMPVQHGQRDGEVVGRVVEELAQGA